MEILGIGTDSVEIERIQKALQSESFLRRVFTEEERRYGQAKGAQGAQSFAGAFAAKEAAVKALGCGFRGFGPESVEVRHDSLGAPYLVLLGEAASYAERLGARRFHLSISHDRTRAVAFVVIEGHTKP